MKTSEPETKHSSSAVGSDQKLSTSVIRRLSTQWHLPTGWENYGFSIRGNGMIIECPFCRDEGITWRPEKEVEPWQKRKVVMVHMRMEHGPGRRPKAPASLRRVK
jgi:hypothetical protein